MATQDITTLEKHFQTCIGLTVVALVGWAGVTLMLLQQQSAVASVEIASIKTDIKDIRHGGGGVYTREQAKEDWSINRSNISIIDSRIRRIETNPDFAYIEQ